MSLLTANTLFHFAGKTDDVKGKEALLNILETGFRPSYCKEFGKEEMYSEIRNRAIVEVNVPMVCFCDLPLSKLQKHIHTYGKYGLGMSKQWGQHKGLNPVNYVTPDSHLLDFILLANNATFDLYKSLISKFQSLPPLQSYVRDETIDFLSKADVALESFNSVFAYLKPYRGLETKTLYYDEREWRYVVPARPEGNKTPVIAAFVNDIEKVTAEAKRILWEEKDRWLSFEHSDIKYIIVKDDSDIGDVLKHLDEINQRQPGRYDKKAVDRLISRILTYEQIQEDF